MSRVVSVVVPVPTLDRLSYSVPSSLPFPSIGSRVLVPVGARVMTGCVLGVGEEMASGSLKPVMDILDGGPLLPADVVELALWVGEYYGCGAGQAVAAAMPPHAWIVGERHAQITDAGRETLGELPTTVRGLVLGLLADGAPHPAAHVGRHLAAHGRGGSRGGGHHAVLAALAKEGLVMVTQPLRGSVSAFKSNRVARITADGRALPDETDGRLGVKQRQALERLRIAPDGVPLAILAKDGISSSTMRRLEARGAVIVVPVVVERDPWKQDAHQHGDTTAREPLTLTAEQQAVVDTLERSAGTGQFEVALLHGVTGSGKTEVYVRLAQVAVARQRKALVLVPEIALTPGVATRLREAFGARVAVQHSGLSDGERHDQWHRIRRGDVDVVVGTRSAVFAPLPALGLIVVDEEHDASYKQEESPRYHGRDVAVMRGKQSGALVVLGSATPSLETFTHACRGRYQRLTLSRRVHSRPLPAVTLVDMREVLATEGPDVVLSQTLSEALGYCVARGQQALVLLNRRGYAASVLCRQCGRSLECPNCSVTLTYHRAAGRARCHYCGYSRGRPKSCPECHGEYLEQVGFGTERVESEIIAQWPGARVARLDRDTVRRRGAAARLLRRFAAADLDVLVGTQMVAKGHDFPRVTLVGVISADVGLGVADFRAAERTFQLLTQVAGRAGRGESPGEAIIQTIHPDHYSIRYACDQAYEPFYAEEIRFRESMRYPPWLSLVCIVVRGRSQSRTMADAAELAARLRELNARFTVLGPAPAPIARLRGQYRAQLFMKGRHRRAMREALLGVLDQRADLKRRVIVDVDPLNML